MKDALARAAAWLVEAAPEPPEVPSVRSFGAPATNKADASTKSATPLREARIGPMELRARPMELRVVETPARPFIAVVGVAPGCGATTLARALAATLARRDHSGAAIVASPHEPTGPSLSTRPAARLAARMSASATGRLCLTRADDVTSFARRAPVVLDLGVAASTAQLTILIAPGDAEPALAELASRALNKALTVVTRTDEPARWDGRALLVLPHSRLGARLANAGWEPHGALGAAVARIADACEEAACAA